MNRHSQDDPRIFCNFNTLLRLQGKAVGFTFLPHHQAGSRLSGRHQSRFRGRGLNFEEFRHYVVGDDIRTLDWRVTLRTGEPYVRVYSEEKDLQVILCIDQRANMFFSSIDTMKSVVAAQLAALSAWRVQKDNDRVGGLVFNDSSHYWFTPQRSRDHVMRMLRGIASFNRKLVGLETQVDPVNAEVAFARMLKQLSQLKLKNTLVVFFSDFKGLTEVTAQPIKQLQQHNDVLGVMISDPMEFDIKLTSDFYASDGDLQVAILQDEQELQQNFKTIARQHKQDVNALFAAHGIPLAEVDTTGEHVAQFQRQISGVVYANN